MLTICVYGCLVVVFGMKFWFLESHRALAIFGVVLVERVEGGSVIMQSRSTGSDKNRKF